MLIRNISTNEVKDHKDFFYNISFSGGTPTSEWLSENGYEEVIPDPIVPTLEQLELQRQHNLDLLWRQATTYQEKYISGAAIGLLTIGVIQNKPKALAIMTWVQNIWNNHYYPKKALVTHEYQPYDFSICGEMPYSIPELTQEVLS